MNDKYISVSQLTKYIKYKIDNDNHLQEVFLRGEISNFKNHTRGHFYFTLKDETSRINAVMFGSSASKIKFTPQDGMKVLVTGKISVYEQTGGYQIYVNDMLEDGVGNLHIAFEQLKKKLQSDGLFDESIKKPIPKIPKRVGVITAPTGAAIKDIISTLKRRWPLTEIILLPALVQGDLAKDDIVKQIENSINYNLDTLIIGRGGGSIEDLWAFNEEIVAQAIYKCPIPIISAVGHEIDFTISDFVADLRAPTPTGAAEMAVPQIQEVTSYIKQLDIRLSKVISNQLNFNKEKLLNIKSRYIFKDPTTLYQPKELAYSTLLDRLKYATTNLVRIKENKYKQITSSYILSKPNLLIESKTNKYLNLISKLETLSPLKTIKRGYTITKLNNKVITSSKNLKKKDKLSIEFNDGIVETEVL